MGLHDVPYGSAAGDTELVYRYTVAGSDKTSIDTGVDAASAGSQDWTNGDLLEIWLLARTDDASAAAAVDVILNNDSGANYDVQRSNSVNATITASSAQAQTQFRKSLHGSGGAANYPGMMHITMPGYADTTFYKLMHVSSGTNDSTAGSNQLEATLCTYRSTSAITRVKVAPFTGGAKLKVGTQLLIYKRRTR